MKWTLLCANELNINEQVFKMLLMGRLYQDPSQGNTAIECVEDMTICSLLVKHKSETSKSVWNHLIEELNCDIKLEGEDIFLHLEPTVPVHFNC